MAIMDEASQIRDKVDIVSLISEYIPLKKMGRNFKTNCPFHNEKSPSFVVSPERQIWHCFGCGKGGDIFSFLMEYENMEFPESLRVLAQKAGIQLKQSNFKAGQSFQKEKIYEINKHALKFYTFILLKHKAGERARDYLLKKRGLNKNILNTFNIGFAPGTNNALTNYLKVKKKYNSSDLIAAGVSIEINGRLLDFFRGRIIFPLFDHRGNVTGFSGRSLNETDMPKYINTKDTPVYHKGTMFFGLNLAKEEIKSKENVIIVEGEFDVIALFMEGVTNSVAIKGTALTESQVSLISRFTPKVTLCLDQDSAGFEATKRSLEILEKKELTINVLEIKNGKDPDESIKNDPSAFKKELKANISVYDFLISKLTQEKNLNIESKKNITDTLIPIFSKISNEIVKEHYIKKLSSILNISYESLSREMEKVEKKKEEEKITIVKKEKKPRRMVLEEYLIALIVQAKNTKDLLGEINKTLSDYEFEVKSYKQVIEALEEYLKKHELFDSKKFANYLPSESVSSFDFAFIYPIPKFESEQKYLGEVEKILKELVSFDTKDKLKKKIKGLN